MSYNNIRYRNIINGELSMSQHKCDKTEHEAMVNERIKDNLTSYSDFEALSNIFQQLGDPTRLRIFWLLCHYEENVMSISNILDVSSPAVSHHLRPLKNSGLIVSRRQGKEVYYKAAETKECNLLHNAIEEAMQIACPHIITD